MATPEVADERAASHRRFLKSAEEAKAELPTALAKMKQRVADYVKDMGADAQHDADFYLKVGKEDVSRAYSDHKKRLDLLAELLNKEHEKVRSKTDDVCVNYNVSNVCKANEALYRIKLRQHMSKFT